MTDQNKTEKWNKTREVFSGGDNKLSSFRIMAMIGLIGGLVILGLDILLINSTRSYEMVYVVLFGGIFGGKAWQKVSEKK
ncbi:MAG: hypothetical protein OXH31_09130 [Gammaproteobacteria bacterium]|nr:hypothetical protein [Gammaproteobacteria bacterium]